MESVGLHQPVLGIIVPETSSGDVTEVFTAVTSQSHALFEENKVSSIIPQRSILHFGQFPICYTWFIDLTHFRQSLDELVPIFVVLQTQYQNEGQLRSYISRLNIKVEAQAFSSSRQEAHKDQSPSPNRDIIGSVTVHPSKEYSIFVTNNGLENEVSWSYVVWKEAAHLSECNSPDSSQGFVNTYLQLAPGYDCRSQQLASEFLVV